MPRKLARRSGAVLLGILAGCALSEIGVRVFRLQPERYARPRWLAWDGAQFVDCGLWGGGMIKRPSRFSTQGVRMGEYLPNAQFKVVYASNPRGYFDDDNGVLMTINRIGVRGSVSSFAKPAGVYRILGLGDSFTFGVGVRDGDTFLSLLAERLKAHAGREERVEVANAGVQGYNTRDEVLYLAHQWLRLAPDLVLITFYLNDAYDDLAFHNNGKGLGVYLERPSGLARYSRAWDLVQHRYRSARESKALEQYYHRPYFSDAPNYLSGGEEAEVDWPACVRALRRARQLTRSRGIELSLVIFPELYKLDGRYPFLAIHRLVQETCASLGIPALDLLSAFRGRDARDLWVHPTDHHPNELAHQIAADALYEFVTELRRKQEGRARHTHGGYGR